MLSVILPELCEITHGKGVVNVIKGAPADLAETPWILRARRNGPAADVGACQPGCVSAVGERVTIGFTPARRIEWCAW